MRTTVTLDDDVAVAVDQLRRERGLGTSAAVNALARQGLAQGTTTPGTFRQQVSSLGTARIPLDDVAGALAVLEHEAHRG
ncbi:MAG: ribbon-helix-helix domain-containing protein [Actinomycetota bacterium]|nr:ribbon-helix-helix domain-containing protein [Actinomycetota bacterium]